MISPSLRDIHIGMHHKGSLPFTAMQVHTPPPKPTGKSEQRDSTLVAVVVASQLQKNQ